MTPSELKHLYESNNPSGHFFDRKTMRFFGDTMRNYGLVTTRVESRWNESGKYLGDGNYRKLEAYKLYRRRPVKHGIDSDTYFDFNGKELGNVTEI